jgi:hypothetical protein
MSPALSCGGHVWCRSLMVVAALLGSPVMASAQCVSFGEGEFRTMVEASQKAIDQDDAYKHKQLMVEFVRMLPCLDMQLPKDAWARFLVSESILRYTTEEDWRGALNTALEIWPDVPGVPPFILEEWGPEAPAPPLNDTIPDGTTFFVDGVLVDRAPELTGLHVIQRLVNGEWDSRMVENGTWPRAWFDARVVLDERGNPIDPSAQASGRGETRPRMALGVLVGVGHESQSVEPAGTYLGNGRRTGPVGGLALWGEIPVVSVVGLFADTKLPVQVPSVLSNDEQSRLELDVAPAILADAYGGFAVVLPQFAVHVGGGITQLRVTEGDTSRTFTFPQPRLAVEAISPTADFLVGGGYTPSATHVDLRVTFQASERNGWSWRVGPLFEAANARFVEQKPGLGREASVFRGRAIFLVSVARGRP